MTPKAQKIRVARRAMRNVEPQVEQQCSFQQEPIGWCNMQASGAVVRCRQLAVRLNPVGRKPYANGQPPVRVIASRNLTTVKLYRTFGDRQT